MAGGRWEEEVVLQHGDSPGDEAGEVRLRIRELPMADGVHASTGCQLWSASIALARELWRRPQLVAGRRVLEVGAGCGLVGITAARLARETLITDGDEEVVQNVEHNIQINGPFLGHVAAVGSDAGRARVSARTLRWEEALERPWASDERFEVILASDVIYGHWGDTLAMAMLGMLAPGGCIALIASEDRRCGVQSFRETLGEAGFRVAETKLTLALGTFRLFECRERLPGEPAEPPPLAERSEVGAGVLAPSAVPAAALAVVAPPVALAAVAPKPRLWKVTGGVLNLKGIIVRSGVSGAAGALSGYAGRLGHGAIIQEVERTAEKLRYRKVEGNGPREGWVSFLSGRGARLLHRLESELVVS